jgi:hypothetical protein
MVQAIGRQHLTGAQSMRRTLTNRLSLLLVLVLVADPGVPILNDAWISE